MIAYKNDTFAYPFTCYYTGFLADLESDSQFVPSIFSVAENSFVDIRVFLDIKEMIQVSNEVLIIGTFFINKLDNKLPSGDYRLKLSVEVLDLTVDLLYAPFSISDSQNPFIVSVINLYPQIDFLLKDVIQSGVKEGFGIIQGTQEMSYSVRPGVLFASDGMKISNPSLIVDAFRVDAGDYSRTDTVCLFYNSQLLDEWNNVPAPMFRVLKGKSDSELASLPPFHYVIGYIQVPLGADTPSDTQISSHRDVVSRRPFFNVPAQELADGTRSIFSFPFTFIPRTSTLVVDGVKQTPGVSYNELPSALGKGYVQFIGEVPVTGQSVALSGFMSVGPFYNFDYSMPPMVPVTPSIVPALYTRTNLIGEFKPENLTDTRWNNSAGEEDFSQAVLGNMPLKGWDATNKDYVFFGGTHWMTMGPNMLHGATQFTIAFKGDFRDASVNDNWMRVLTKLTGDLKPSFRLTIVNNATPQIKYSSGENFPLVQILPDYFWNRGPVRIVCSRSSSGLLSLYFKSEDDAVVMQNTGEFLQWSPVSSWILGGEEGIGAGSRLNGKLTLILFYDRCLSEQEINLI